MPGRGARGHLRTALADASFRRLLSTRLLGQFGDGIFQVSLAATVLFNPERQADASDVAAGFAVVLIPYSLIGPFAGVLLDRWRRQRTLVYANLLRALCVLVVVAVTAAGVDGFPYYLSALVVISISRFVLSGLSASLPHVVGTDDLLTANALSTTVGGLIATVGGAAAVGVRSGIGETNGDYAFIASLAAIAYVVAGVAARWFAPDQLGPDDVERGNRESVAEVARGFVEGARHVRRRPVVFAALTAIGVHRLCYGVTIVCTVLLYRNYFHGHGVLRSGLAGLTQVVVVVAIGGAIAAIITPGATRRFGYVRWPVALLVLAAVTQATLVLAYSLSLSIASALLLGFTAQGIKICVDTLVQRDVDDAFRGRVFTLYDTLFNLTLVAAALLTALVLPDDGHAPVSVVVIAVAYAATAALYLRMTRAYVSSAAAPTTA